MNSAELFQAINQQSDFDVVNHSWGFTNGFVSNSLSASWSNFFGGIEDAVQNGRGGLGTIMVQRLLEMIEARTGTPMIPTLPVGTRNHRGWRIQP